MTLQEFWDMLDRHDWYYHFSDCSKTFSRGRQSENNLHSVATSNGPEFKEMLDAFHTHKFSGEHYGTEKQPKPDRPGGPRDVSKSQIPF